VRVRVVFGVLGVDRYIAVVNDHMLLGNGDAAFKFGFAGGNLDREFTELRELRNVLLGPADCRKQKQKERRRLAGPNMGRDQEH